MKAKIKKSIKKQRSNLFRYFWPVLSIALFFFGFLFVHQVYNEIVPKNLPSEIIPFEFSNNGNISLICLRSFKFGKTLVEDDFIECEIIANDIPKEFMGDTLHVNIITNKRIMDYEENEEYYHQEIQIANLSLHDPYYFVMKTPPTPDLFTFAIEIKNGSKSVTYPSYPENKIVWFSPYSKSFILDTKTKATILLVTSILSLFSIFPGVKFLRDMIIDT